MAIWSVFWQNEDLGISFPGVRCKQLVRIAVDRCFLCSQTGLNIPCRSMRAGGVSACQETPWSLEVDDKELHGALGGEYDLELTGSTVSCTSSTWSQPTFRHLQVWYYADFKG